MDLYAVIDQVTNLLRQFGRVSYRSIQLQFGLTVEQLAAVSEELTTVRELAVDKDGKMLVWVGEPEERSTESGERRTHEEETVRTQESKAILRSTLSAPRPVPHAPRTDGERRQLTVMFIDLVGSTTLSQQLDPEDYHGRVVAYQAACHQVIARYEGHIAQYLGDGVLVYFGYPTAHEEDAVRAVRSGLEIIAAVSLLAYTPPLQVRIGIHTGPVVVGEIGAGERTERLALGETPNLAARVQGAAVPDTVVMSTVTHRLVQGLFECQDLGPQTLKGISTPLSLYRVIGESVAQSRFEVAVGTGLTPLVGRVEELALLQRCWEQARAGAGQVVLLSGEPGIGKSRLVQELKEQLAHEEGTRIEFRCSPYHQNSALYPITEHLQRLLQFAREDAPATKLEKLKHTLSHYRFPQADTVPLLAALLSLLHPEGYPAITVSPQKQKEKTQAALVAWLVEEAEQNTVYNAWEDLHWADPSTMEVLTLLLDQVPTTRLLAVLTFRPEFTPPWGNRSHLSQLTLRRLVRPHVETMVEQVTHGKPLPPEILQQIVSKTDGVPLFVEELTKTVVESGLLREEGDRYVGAHGSTPISSLAIPSTLQDSLMARLDRLAPVKELAQLGATLGREFSYELLHAVSPLDEDSLQQGLRQLVEVELLYQRGLPPHATYLFKHALIQDTAYQSLLKSKRQHYHQQIAQVIEERFSEIKEIQPELLAHHYTEAGLIAYAVPYWQQAGQRASQRSANEEAVTHLTTGLDLVKTLPDTPERTQQEVTLQIMLASALLVTKGLGAHEVRKAYDNARELAQRVGETPQLFRVLYGLSGYYIQQEEMQIASDLAEQCLALAEKQQDSVLIIAACRLLGSTSFWSGNLVLTREYCERGMTHYDPPRHRSLALVYGFDLGVFCLVVESWALWHLGYPDQALQRSQTALTLAHELNHPYTLALALNTASWTCYYRREGQAAYTLADEAIALSTAQDFPHWLAMGLQRRGEALIELGQWEEGIAQLRQGGKAYQATGALLGNRGCHIAELARAYGYQGRCEEGLQMLAAALEVTNETGVRHYEAEMYRIKGELTLKKSGVRSPRSEVSKFQSQAPKSPIEAEECLLKAIEIAQSQKAKSWELRATVNLARLWQQQGKQAEAHRMLSEIYNWFTEGFATKDLQEAKALLDELAKGNV